MESVLKVLHENMIFFILLGFANVVPAVIIARYISLTRSKRVADALGPRCMEHSLYRRCSGLFEHGVAFFEKRLDKGSIYNRAKQKLQKAGYKGEHSAILYLAVKFVLLPITFVLSLFLNYPDIMPPIAAIVLINAITEAIISSGKRKLNLRFQKYIYKPVSYTHLRRRRWR